MSQFRDYVTSELNELETQDADQLFECIRDNLLEMGLDMTDAHDDALYAEIERQLAVKRARTETQVRREIRALLASANERIGEGHYGIAESCLKRALTCLDEASDIKLRGKS